MSRRGRPTSAVLVVCTANVCRSPISAIMLDRVLLDRGLDAVVESAGFYEAGMPAGRTMTTFGSEAWPPPPGPPSPHGPGPPRAGTLGPPWEHSAPVLLAAYDRLWPAPGAGESSTSTRRRRTPGDQPAGAHAVIAQAGGSVLGVAPEHGLHGSADQVGLDTLIKRAPVHLERAGDAVDRLAHLVGSMREAHDQGGHNKATLDGLLKEERPEWL
jgi:Low molecular weight phosphotyrosine protein phosphatase